MSILKSIFLLFAMASISHQVSAKNYDLASQAPHSPILGLDGLHSSITIEMLAVIKNQKQFSKIWHLHSADYSPALEMPIIDFDLWQVIAVFLGESLHCNKSFGSSSYTGEDDSTINIGLTVLMSEPKECAPERPHKFLIIPQNDKFVKVEFEVKNSL